MSENKITTMIGNIADKDLVNAEVQFQSVMNDKVAAQLAIAKETLAKSMFNSAGELDLEKAEAE
jgi:hypothetical protein